MTLKVSLLDPSSFYKLVTNNRIDFLGDEVEPLTAAESTTISHSLLQPQKSSNYGTYISSTPTPTGSFTIEHLLNAKVPESEQRLQQTESRSSLKRLSQNFGSSFNLGSMSNGSSSSLGADSSSKGSATSRKPIPTRTNRNSSYVSASPSVSSFIGSGSAISGKSRLNEYANSQPTTRENTFSPNTTTTSPSRTSSNSPSKTERILEETESIQLSDGTAAPLPALHKLSLSSLDKKAEAGSLPPARRETSASSSGVRGPREMPTSQNGVVSVGYTSPQAPAVPFESAAVSLEVPVKDLAQEPEIPFVDAAEAQDVSIEQTEEDTSVPFVDAPLAPATPSDDIPQEYHVPFEEASDVPVAPVEVASQEPVVPAVELSQEPKATIAVPQPTEPSFVHDPVEPVSHIPEPQYKAPEVPKFTEHEAAPVSVLDESARAPELPIQTSETFNTPLPEEPARVIAPQDPEPVVPETPAKSHTYRALLLDDDDEEDTPFGHPSISSQSAVPTTAPNGAVNDYAASASSRVHHVPHNPSPDSAPSAVHSQGHQEPGQDKTPHLYHQLAMDEPSSGFHNTTSYTATTTGAADHSDTTPAFRNIEHSTNKPDFNSFSFVPDNNNNRGGRLNSSEPHPQEPSAYSAAPTATTKYQNADTSATEAPTHRPVVLTRESTIEDWHSASDFQPGDSDNFMANSQQIAPEAQAPSYTMSDRSAAKLGQEPAPANSHPDTTTHLTALDTRDQRKLSNFSGLSRLTAVSPTSPHMLATSVSPSSTREHFSSFSSPDSSLIFERSVQEFPSVGEMSAPPAVAATNGAGGVAAAAAAASAMTKIPLHHASDDFIPPVLDASTEALTMAGNGGLDLENIDVLSVRSGGNSGLRSRSISDAVGAHSEDGLSTHTATAGYPRKESFASTTSNGFGGAMATSPVGLGMPALPYGGHAAAVRSPSGSALSSVANGGDYQPANHHKLAHNASMGSLKSPPPQPSSTSVGKKDGRVLSFCSFADLVTSEQAAQHAVGSSSVTSPISSTHETVPAGHAEAASPTGLALDTFPAPITITQESAGGAGATVASSPSKLKSSASKHSLLALSEMGVNDNDLAAEGLDVVSLGETLRRNTGIIISHS